MSSLLTRDRQAVAEPNNLRDTSGVLVERLADEDASVLTWQEHPLTHERFQHRSQFLLRFSIKLSVCFEGCGHTLLAYSVQIQP